MGTIMPFPPNARARRGWRAPRARADGATARFTPRDVGATSVGETVRCGSSSTPCLPRRSYRRAAASPGGASGTCGAMIVQQVARQVRDRRGAGHRRAPPPAIFPKWIWRRRAARSRSAAAQGRARAHEAQIAARAARADASALASTLLLAAPSYNSTKSPTNVSAARGGGAAGRRAARARRVLCPRA